MKKLKYSTGPYKYEMAAPKIQILNRSDLNTVGALNTLYLVFTEYQQRKRKNSPF